ncbi:MAG TPA: hypothetical protein VHH72_08515 [Solirubrobacterales bacterium]|jgi:hypothetical protein|nr:hypothetical protein [Solirubrobacterales bacterium]
MDASTATTTTPASGNGRYVPPPPGTRSAAQIRADVVKQRTELARSVDVLRERWSEATDIKAQIGKHRTELLVGAAVVGCIVGGVFALRRRRR